MRGPGVPAGRVVRGQVGEHGLRADAARRRRREGRPHAGRRVAAAGGARPAQAPEPRDRARGAAPPVRRRLRPVQRLGPAVHGRAHRPLHVRRLHGDRRAELYDRKKDPHQLAQRRGRPGLRARWSSGSRRSESRCAAARARSAGSRREARGAGTPGVNRAGGRRSTGGRRAPEGARRPPRRALLRDPRAEGRAAERHGRPSGTRSGSNRCPAAEWEAFDAGGAGEGARRHVRAPERPAPLPHGLRDGHDRRASRPSTA